MKMTLPPMATHLTRLQRLVLVCIVTLHRRIPVLFLVKRKVLLVHAVLLVLLMLLVLLVLLTLSRRPTQSQMRSS
jgi:hypothetical protein